ncbi:MAG TPA: CoA ester lyase [Gammaproteobacteria bacterium]|nr:CoA ester lyase [Gammaproteobacteria bacterium]
MSVLRSMLFVPGDSEKKLAKGAGVGADALILDLEDAVAAARRPLAREMICEYLQSADRTRGELWVRMNPLDSADSLRDIAAVVRARPDGIALPKCNGPEDVQQLSHWLDVLEVEHGIAGGSIAICAIATETAVAPFSLGRYKGAPRLRILTWGAEDLSAALGASTNKDAAGVYTAPYVLARSLCLFGAYAAGVQGLDTVQPDFRNPAKLREECNDARRDGFLGKIAIHPDQVAVINECFTPSAEEIAHAQAVIAAFAANPDAGTLSLDGKMIDMPHLKQAERLMSIVNRRG